MDDDLNMIWTEGKGYLLNCAFESDSIEGNSSKIFEKMPYHPFIFKNENPCPLHIDKPTFYHFVCYVIMGIEHEGQRYSTSYYKN